MPMSFLFKWNKRKAAEEKEGVKLQAYAAALPAPRLFPVAGRVVVKLLECDNAGLVIQTIGRVNRGDVSSAYAFEDRIAGSGSTGLVRVAVQRHTGRRFAIKSFVKALASKEKVNLLRNEAQILLKVDHPHIARLIEVWEDSSAVHLVMEYCAQGHLLDWLSHRKALGGNDPVENEKLGKALVTQMLRAVLYLHTQQIVHRDLCTEHWLIDGAWSGLGYGEAHDIPYLKLIDFGTARTFTPESRYMRASCGALPYVAPEVLLGNYNMECDMWSLGVITYLILTGNPPFHGSESEIAEKILNGPEVRLPRRVREVVSPECSDFIHKMLNRSLSDRVSAREAFNHPWILPRPVKPLEALDPGLGARLYGTLPHALSMVPHFKFFRKLCLALLAFGLTSDEMEEARDIFTYLDYDGTGVISSQQLQTFLGELDSHFTSSTCHQIAESLDIFQRGGVYFNDFICCLLGEFIHVDEQAIRNTFWKFDRRRTGLISVENMREVLGSLYGDRKLEAFLREADRDGDKNIDYDEFLHIILGG